MLLREWISGKISSLARWGWPLFFALATALALSHIVYGGRGLQAREKLAAQVADAERRLELITSERERLEARATMLRPQGIDPDLVEERIRLQLGLIHPDEVILTIP